MSAVEGNESRASGEGPRWPLAILLLILLAGAAIGAMMTWHHEASLYGGVTDAGELIGCTSTGAVNCDVVNTSEYSEVLGVPIAAWGFATYLLLAGLVGRALRGDRRGLPIVLAAGVGATLYSVFLYYISKTQLHYVCAWCLRLYGINAATVVLALVARAWRGGMPPARVLAGSAIAFLALSAVAIGGDRAYRHHLMGGARAIELPRGGSQPVEMEVDPAGSAPSRRWTVKTEDGNEAPLEVKPDDPWRGERDAKVTVVEFLDLECGYCKRTAAELEKLYPAYKDKVLFVEKLYPMNPDCNKGVSHRLHRHACEAARAAVCAREQGRYWRFSQITFKNQHALEPADLRMYADRAGLDLSRYDACMRSPESKRAVLDDAAQGASLDIHGTPRIFIDGKLYKGGRSAQQIARQLERELGASPAEANKVAFQLSNAGNAPAAQIPDDVPPTRHITYGDLSFDIDTFEDAVEDGRAVSGKGLIPATRLSWYAARDACRAAGKRLCTEEEWLAACQGARPVDDDHDGRFADDMIEGTAYPYGDYHEVGRCWDGRQRGTARPVYTGEMPGCVSKDGVYDLTGNVEEWVGDSPENAALMGGAFDTSEDHARCYRRNDTFGPGLANERTGFRCCGGDNRAR